MNLPKIAFQIQRLAKDNAPLILTTMGAAGSVLASYQTARATFKSAEKLRIAAIRENMQEKGHELTTAEKVKVIWKEYIVPVSTLTGSVVAIVYAHRINTRRMAGLAIAYSLTEKNFDEYKAKIQEKLGVGKEQAARDELAQDRFNANPPSEAQLLMVGGGDILCMDQYSGRYFKSDMETLRRAENDINFQIVNKMYASLSDFYEQIGLPATSFSEEVGWNMHNKLVLRFSSVLTQDGKPAIAFDFKAMPIRNYDFTNCLGDS